MSRTTPLVLFVLLASSPGWAKTASTREYQASLTQPAPRYGSVHLLPVLDEREAPSPRAPLTPGDRAALEAEYANLDAHPAGLVLPIVLLAGGVGCLYVGSLVALTGAVASGATASTGLVLTGAIIMITGVAAAISGGVLLTLAIISRVHRTHRMNELEEQLRGQPFNDSTVAPPTSVERVLPNGGATVVVAEF